LVVGGRADIGSVNMGTMVDGSELRIGQSGGIFLLTDLFHSMAYDERADWVYQLRAAIVDTRHRHHHYYPLD